MATKKKTIKKETMTVSIELPVTPNYNHFVTIKDKTVDFVCSGNNKWISISKLEDLANDFNYCPFCGIKLDGLGLHKSIAKLIQPNERYRV